MPQDSLTSVDSIAQADSLAVDSLAMLTDSLSRLDSALAIAAPPTSFFGNKVFHSDMVGQPIPHDDGWLLIIFFLALGLFAYVRMNYSRRLSQVFKAALNTSSAKEMMREENPLSQRTSVILSIIFLLLMPVLIYKTIVLYSPALASGTGFLLYLKIVGLLTLAYLLKLLFLRVTSTALNSTYTASEYIFNLFLLSQVSGLFIFPVAVLLTYSFFSPAPLLVIGFFIFFFSYIVRIFRGFSMSWRRPGVSSLHLFYYFCALELVPAIVLTKVFFIITASN